MKKGIAPIALSLAVFAAPAMAQDPTGFFAGGGIVNTKFRDSGTDFFDDTNTTSFVIGFKPASWNGFGVEGQLMEGEVISEDNDHWYNDDEDNLEFDYTSVGIYASYRTAHRGYFKGRIGALWQEWESKDDPALDRDETIAAAGIGFGWRIGRGQLEVERLINDSDLRQFSVTFSFNF